MWGYLEPFSTTQRKSRGYCLFSSLVFVGKTPQMVSRNLRVGTAMFNWFLKIAREKKEEQALASRQTPEELAEPLQTRGPANRKSFALASTPK